MIFLVEDSTIRAGAWRHLCEFPPTIPAIWKRRSLEGFEHGEQCCHDFNLTTRNGVLKDVFRYGMDGNRRIFLTRDLAWRSIGVWGSEEAFGTACSHVLAFIFRFRVSCGKRGRVLAAFTRPHPIGCDRNPKPGQLSNLTSQPIAISLFSEEANVLHLSFLLWLISGPDGMVSNPFDGLEGVPSGEHSRVQEYIDRVNFAALQRRAKECRAMAVAAAEDHESSVLRECSIDPTRFALGRCNIVFEVRFPDVIYIARVFTNHFGVVMEEDTVITAFLQSEVETMRYILDNSNIPIPKVLDYDSNPENPVNFRFILMEALPGQPLGIPYHQIPHEYRAQFLDQLADYLLQLRTLSFCSIGCLRYDLESGSTNIVPFPGKAGVYNTSFDFVYDIRRQQNQLLRTDDKFPSATEDRELAGKVLTFAALKAIRTELGTGPFPLAHPDLHYNNILADAKYNITGIIDWSGVTSVPQEVFASIPGFRTPPGIPAEEVKIYARCLEEFVSALQKRESMLLDQGHWLVISDFVGSDSAECLNKALEEGMPWRGVAYAKYLLPLVFGERATWDRFREEESALILPSFDLICAKF